MNQINVLILQKAYESIDGEYEKTAEGTTVAKLLHQALHNIEVAMNLVMKEQIETITIAIN